MSYALKRRTFALLAAVLLAPAPAFADQVFLKGGASLSGRIVEETDTMITVDIGAGQVGVAKSRVEKVVKGRSPLDEFDERAAKLQSGDVDGWRSLGQWASHQGLSAQSRQAYEKVIATAPDDAVARGGLGYVNVDGRWLTEEEGYKARGYVKYDGEWMTRAEASAAEGVAAADRARQEAETRANMAEADRIQAESRAEKAEERARKAEELDPWEAMNQNTANGVPMYWGGGWGYGVGVTGWPSTTTITTRSGAQVQPFKK